MTQAIVSLVAWIVVVATILVALYSVIFSFRYVARSLIFRTRSRMFLNGPDLIWTRIVPDDAEKDNRTTYTDSDARGIVLLHEAIASKEWPRLNRGLVSYIWTRGDRGQIELYVGMDRRHYQEQILRQFARSIDASAILVEEPPILPTDAIVVSERDSNNIMGVHDSLPEIGKVVENFSTLFDPNDMSRSGAIVITVEAVPNVERSRLQAFFADRQSEVGGTVGSFSAAGNKIGSATTQCVRASIVATANEEGLARSISNTVTSSVSILPVTFRMQSARSLRPVVIYGLVFSVLMSLIGACATYFTGVRGITLIAALVASGISIFGAISTKLVNVTAHNTLANSIEKGYIQPSPFMYLSPRWLVSRFTGARNPEFPDSNKRMTAYPSDNQMVYVQPLAMLDMISFPSSVASLAVNLTRKQWPARGVRAEYLNQPEPVYLGLSGEDQVVYASALEIFHKPSVCFGAMGSGKTNLIDVIFLNSVYAGLNPRIPLQVTSIWGETKGPDAAKVWNQVRHINGAMLVEMYDRNGKFRLAMEGPRYGDRVFGQPTTAQDIRTNVAALVGGLQAAWGSGIGAESRNTLMQALLIAMLLSHDDLDYLGISHLLENPDRPNIMKLAFWILRGDLYSADIGERLLALASALSSDTEADDRQTLLYQTINMFGRYVDPKTWKQYDNLLNPPRNKLSDMLTISIMWEPYSRRDIYIQQLTTAFRPIIINLGPPAIMEKSDQFNAELSNRMLACFNHLLWGQVQIQCHGWEPQGKRIVVCYDEVKNVALASGRSDDVVDSLDAELRMGRAFGFSVHLGSQQPEQLPPPVLSIILAIVNKSWFRLASSNDVNIAVNDLAHGDRNMLVYSHATIGTLPQGVAAAVWELRKDQITTPFTLRVPEANLWGSILLNLSHENPGELPTMEEAVSRFLMEWEARTNPSFEVIEESPKYPMLEARR